MWLSSPHFHVFSYYRRVSVYLDCIRNPALAIALPADYRLGFGAVGLQYRGRLLRWG